MTIQPLYYRLKQTVMNLKIQIIRGVIFHTMTGVVAQTQIIVVMGFVVVEEYMNRVL